MRVPLCFSSNIRDTWTPEHDMEVRSDSHPHRKRNSKAFLIESLVTNGTAAAENFSERGESEIDNYHQRPYKRVKLEGNGVARVDPFTTISPDENTISPVRMVTPSFVTWAMNDYPNSLEMAHRRTLRTPAR